MFRDILHMDTNKTLMYEKRGTRFVLKEQLRTIDLFWKNLKSPRTCKNRTSTVEVEEEKRGQTSVAEGLRPGPLSIP